MQRSLGTAFSLVRTPGVFALVALALMTGARAARADAPGEAEGSAPAPLDGPKTVTLPAPADDVVPGGGGRYLLLKLDKLSKLAVYDVAADRIKGYIPTGSPDTLVAAGAEKAVLVSRDKNVIQRWNLDTLQKELTVALLVGQADAMAMGHASQGPLMIMTRTGPQFLSLQTLKPADVTFANTNSYHEWQSHPQHPLSISVSADGQTFSAWYRGLSPQGIRVLRLQGDVATTRHEHNTAGILLPSWDGSLLFTQQGIYSADLKMLAEDQFKQKTCIPAYRPGYFLTVNVNSFDHGSNNRPGKPGVSVSVYTSADRSMLVTLPPMPEMTQPRDAFNAQGTLSWPDRVFLVPQHQRLVTVSDTRDQLVVRPFDIMATLNKAGIDYLFVDSLPVTVADPGKAYSYPIVVQSKKGGLKFSLDSGPDGMKLSKDGVLSWQVPADAESGPAGVIVTVEDAAGQSVFHTFNVNVTATPGRPGVGGAKRIDLGPDPNGRFGHMRPGYPGHPGSGGGPPPVVRAVKKKPTAKGSASAKTE